MRPVATDGVSWSVCLFVCLLVTFVSPEKWLNQSRCCLGLTWVGSKYHVLDEIQIPQGEEAILGVVVQPSEKHGKS